MQRVMMRLHNALPNLAYAWQLGLHARLVTPSSD
jgi:hypothetical protein